MNYTLLWIGMVIAFIDWVAVVKQWKAVEYFAKPGVTLALLAWLWNAGGWQSHLIWFVTGLAFSLAGDILLVLPREQLIAGLGAFLLAQIAYIVGLNQTPPPINLVSITIALLVWLTALRVYRLIAAGLAASDLHTLKMPVLAYVVTISLMLISALLTLVRSEWDAGASLLISSGAILFFISDALLGWNKFVRLHRYGNIQVIITYHLGQALIVLGAAAHFK